MLESRFDLRSATILDLFAGTGSLGMEALSRGAGRAVFVEQGRTALRVLRANLDACGFVEQAEVWPVAVRRGLRELDSRGDHFDGVFMDPPYGRGLLEATLEQLVATRLLRPGSWVVAEGHVDDMLAEGYGALQLTRNRRYGKTSIVLYSLMNAEEGLEGM
jgi:16S rRNA (guanine(966)-N(2))-methyltransferase RsmD